MKKMAKRVLALCMAATMMVGITSTALAAEGKTVNLSTYGFDEPYLSLSNVVETTNEIYTQYDTEPAYICNSPAVIQSQSQEIGSLIINKVEFINGEWTAVKSIPVIGKYKIHYWDEEHDPWSSEYTGELSVNYEDLDKIIASSKYNYEVVWLEVGSTATLTEEGIYSVSTSDPSRQSEDSSNTVIIRGNNDVGSNTNTAASEVPYNGNQPSLSGEDKVYLKGVDGRMDDAISITNVIRNDAKGSIDGEQTYYCASPVELKTNFNLNYFEVTKVEMVNDSWVSVKEMPVSGDSIFLFWDNTNQTEKEIIIHDGESFDAEDYEKTHPQYSFTGGMYAAGSKYTLTETGVYKLTSSGTGSNPDNVNAFIVIEGNSSNKVQAKPTASDVLVNGKQISFDSYNIGGSNYVKLRDLAYALNGTGKQFEVKWDNSRNAIVLTSKTGYTVAGGELESNGSGNKNAVQASSKIILDGKEIVLNAYNIDGNNYFKLRDVGQIFNFGVEWDGTRNAIAINTDVGYSE